MILCKFGYYLNLFESIICIELYMINIVTVINMLTLLIFKIKIFITACFYNPLSFINENQAIYFVRVI